MVNSLAQNLLAGRTSFELGLWGIAFLLILVAMVWAVRQERRKYQALGKQASWLRLRLLSIPILALTGLSVLLPARAISGPEALAYLYAALFTVAPLLWFGLHALCGSILSPRLTREESTRVALSGLALLIGPALAISLLQTPIFEASRRWTKRAFDRAEPAALPHTIQPMRRFRLGDAGVIDTQTLRAPAGLRLERIEALLGNNWHNTKTMTHPYLCRQGDDLHLAWPAGSPPPPLRLFWLDHDHTRRQAQFRVDSAAATDPLPGEDFSVGWRDDGLDLPVPISRENVEFGWVGPGENPTIRYRSLDIQPGESFELNCFMLYRRVAWKSEGPIAALKLRFNVPPPAERLEYEMIRPASR